MTSFDKIPTMTIDRYRGPILITPKGEALIPRRDGPANFLELHLPSGMRLRVQYDARLDPRAYMEYRIGSRSVVFGPQAKADILEAEKANTERKRDFEAVVYHEYTHATVADAFSQDRNLQANLSGLFDAHQALGNLWNSFKTYLKGYPLYRERIFSKEGECNFTLAVHELFAYAAERHYVHKGQLGENLIRNAANFLDQLERYAPEMLHRLKYFGIVENGDFFKDYPYILAKMRVVAHATDSHRR